MKYTSKQYAASLSSLLKGRSEKDQAGIIKGFLILLQKRGEFAKRNQIKKEAERMLLREGGIRKVEVETASEVKNIRKEIEEVLGGKIELSEKINAEILGGARILIDEEILIDASAKTLIGKLFVKS